jgi:ribonucleoside-diphosphate reductase alpha chain
MEIKVIKRSGSKEPLNIEKIHQVLEWACEGLADVSISDIEINSQLQFYNNIRSEDIHKVLIKSASDLISLDHPNYQYVASRLLLFHVRKQVWQDIKPSSFYEFIKRRTQTGVYSDEVVTHYSREEISLCEAMMDHERDYSFTYAGLQQLVDKYLIKDRVSGYVHETPQFMYMLIAMVTFKRHPDKMKWVKAAYDAYSQHKINLPTPQMAGLRSPIKQYASCTLIDVGDSLDSIFASATAVGKYTAKRAGIGLNIGRIRGLGSKIRGGEVVHTGVIPYLKLLEAAAKSTTQNGIRGGGGTVYFPFWHQEVKDLIVLKNNKGNDENRVRKLDYNVQLSKLFYQRLREKKDITLFSPHDVPGLYDAFGTPEFDELYVKYEQDKKIPKTKVPAEELAKEIATERVETGRIYIMNIDHVNSHSSFNTVIKLSNLCVEITLPTSPIENEFDNQGEIALCILAGINLSKAKLDEFPLLCEIIVRALDEIIENQEYPMVAAEKGMKARRSLGVGLMSLAHYLAKHKVKYWDKEAIAIVDRVSEHLQFHLLKASVVLAKEKGACEWYNQTKYSDGLLPIDHYNKNVDKICTRPLELDWEGLREDIKLYGLRNSTLTAQMPGESSSVVVNATNGIEPPKALLSIKTSKQGLLKQIAPDHERLKDHYSLCWDAPDNIGYTNLCAVMQKYFDQSISANHYYDYSKFEEQKLPIALVLKDLIYSYTMGLKTLYYANSNDDNKQADISEESTSGCDSGACTL